MLTGSKQIDQHAINNSYTAHARPDYTKHRRWAFAAIAPAYSTVWSVGGTASASTHQHSFL